MSDAIIVECKIHNKPKGHSKQTKIKPFRDMDNTIHFQDKPNFLPNITPKEMFHAGVFGETYFRPIYSCVTGKSYQNVWKEFPRNWFPSQESMIDSQICDKNRNSWKVISGQSLRTWETNGWIEPIDPYGWVQWYCRFYNGRRCYDDDRQIDRWNPKYLYQLSFK